MKHVRISDIFVLAHASADVQRAVLYCDYGCEDVASGSSEAELGFYSCNQTCSSQSGNDENFNFPASPNKNTPSVDSFGGVGPRRRRGRPSESLNSAIWGYKQKYWLGGEAVSSHILLSQLLLQMIIS